jgi:DMSO/TMAO reductase YedYZ molybdopterin-dependent catalytic subunit
MTTTAGTAAEPSALPDPPVPARNEPNAPRRALAGLLTLAVALAIASLLAALMKVDGPIEVVGNRFIDATPRWLKTFAIDQFGRNDKRALLTGIWVVLVLFAAAVGRIAWTRRMAALGAVAAFGVVGAFAATTRTGSQGGDWLPPIVGAVIGGVALWLLVRSTSAAPPPPAVKTSAPTESPTAYARRRFIATAAATAATAGIAALTSGAVRRSANTRVATARATRASRGLPVPKSVAKPIAPTATAPGGAEPYVTASADFYRIDTALSIPSINVDTWRLRIGGMVDHPLELTYDDLLAMPMIERTVTLTCVSNEIGGDLIGNATFLGVPLADLLKKVGVQAGGEQVASTSDDGWTCGFPTKLALDGRDAMVAVGMNGEVLPTMHGYPARLVVPGLYGYVSATKWLTDIKLTTWDGFNGYWVPRGWSKEGPIKTQSRIDVPKRGAAVTAGKVAVAGVAWAQHRGIAKVELQIDSAPWAEATLADEPTVDAWRQWSYAWDATPGRHVIAVRATDRNGDTQTMEHADVAPNGATGWHTIRVDVR